MSEEDDFAGSSGEEDEEGGFNLNGFMLGNVDSDGQLEADFLDEDAKQNLASLQDAKGGFDIASLAGASAPSGGPSSASTRPSKSAKQADTIGESDISGDEDDWGADDQKPQPLAATTNSQANTAIPPISATAVPSMPAAAFTAFPQQAAFAEEDDYDMEDAPDEAPSAQIAAPAQALPTFPSATPSTASAVNSSIASNAQTAASAGLGYPQAPKLLPPQSIAIAPSGITSVPQNGINVPPAGQPQSVLPVAAPQSAPFQLPVGRNKPVTLQQQVQLAAAAGIALPVVTASNGRSMLRYSDLLVTVDSQPDEPAVEVSTASRARLRAERLNALRQQTSTDAAKVAAAAARGNDSDEESFLHATVTRKLPEHLIESTMLSDESDTDVIHEADDEERTDRTEAQARDKQLGPQTRGRKPKSALVSGQPLYYGPKPPDFDAIPEADFDLVHILPWERDIVWENDSEDESQPPAAGSGQNVEAEDEWADFDRQLGYGDVAAQRKPHAVYLTTTPMLEPLPAMPAKGAKPAAAPLLHPSMLRLHVPDVDGEQTGDVASAGPVVQPLDAVSAQFPSFNQRLADGGWMSHVQWQGYEEGAHIGPPPELLLDMNDSRLTFEMLRGTDVEAFAHAAATVLPAMPKVEPIFRRPIVHDRGGAIMARFNISKDDIYFPAGKQKGDKLGPGSRLHTVQASNMSSIPMGILTRAEMFHRPLGLWNPIMSKKFHIKGQDKLQIGDMLVKLSSLVGANPDWSSQDPLTISFKKVSAEETAEALWNKAKEDKFKGAVFRSPAGNVVGEHTPIIADRRPPGVELIFSQPIQDSVTKEPALELTAIFSSIRVLPTAVANAIPSQSSGAALAPPAAFQKRKDLSGIEGHVVLLEYFEEYPLLLSQPGMGAHLTTYYRRETPGDNAFQRLLKEQDKWKIGKIEPLQPGDDSPFLGQVEEGQSQLAVETGMFRAPGFAYSPPASDYLLIRNAAGIIMLREMTGCIAVGQEVPSVRAPVPFSREMRDIEGGRMEVHVVREMRNKQTKAEKAEAKTGKYLPPKVSVRELKALFPYLTETTIKGRLSKNCDCMPVRAEDQDGWWQLKPGARLPSEAELRRHVTPDQWCAFDSMKAGEHRLYELGVSHHVHLGAVPADKMQLLIEQLPEVQNKKATARQLDLALKTTPWALTHNYVNSERETRGVQVEFAGPGDPTGVGRGFSFVKDVKRSVVQQAAKQKEGKVTGTGADLRRLKVDALKDILREMGVEEKDLAKGTRWALVDLVRALSTHGAGNSKYVRNQRTSTVERMARKHRLCQEIWQRQIAVLANIPEHQAEDSESVDDIGEELKASLADNEAESAPAQAEEEEAQPNEADQAAEDEKEMQAMREAGMLSANPDQPVAKPTEVKKKLEAEPGARRMRRTITYTHQDGEKVVKELIYYQGTDEDKVTYLSSLYGETTPWNWGSRTVKGRTAAKPRALNKTVSQLKAEPASAPEADLDADATAGADPMMLDPMVLDDWEPPPIRRAPSKKGPRKAVRMKSIKGGKKAAPQTICRDCGQPGHVSKNNMKCLNYEPPAPKPEPQLLNPALYNQDPLQGSMLPPLAPAPSGIKLKINTSSKSQPMAAAATAATTATANGFQQAPQAAAQLAGPAEPVVHQLPTAEPQDAVKDDQHVQQAEQNQQLQQYEEQKRLQEAEEQRQQQWVKQERKRKRALERAAEEQRAQAQQQQQLQAAAVKGEPAGQRVTLGKKREAEPDIAVSAGPPKKLKLKVKLPGTAVSPPAPSPAHQPSSSTAAPKASSERPRSSTGPSGADADRPRALAGATGASGPSRAQQGPKKAKASAKAQQSTQAGQHQVQGLSGTAPVQAAAAPARPPAPPKKGVSKKPGMAGRKKLCKILDIVFKEMQKHLADKEGKLMWQVFSVKVNTAKVIDYNKFVPPEDEMWTGRIKTSLTRAQYSSREAFQRDVHQIAKNARAYNTNKQAVCAYPAAVTHADIMYSKCLEELKKHAQELTEAEQQIQAEAAA